MIDGDTKICKTCSVIFTKPINRSRKRWELSQYCSRTCSGKAVIWTEETRRKLSDAKKGKSPNNVVAGWNKGLKNHWNKGSNSKMWKGDKVGITALHDWVKRELGFPNKCEHCGLVSDDHHKIQWSNKSNQYRRDISDWQRLCVSCHKKYDVRERKTQCNHGHSLILNGRLDNKGWRFCDVCRANSSKKYRIKKKKEMSHATN